jgi:glycerol uptake facilitator-like aquaporin
MMKEFVTEVVGTFVFISVIMRHAGKPFGAYTIGLVLAACIVAFSAFGNAHLNPAVSFAFMTKDGMDPMKLVSLITAQALGGYAAATIGF